MLQGPGSAASCTPWTLEKGEDGEANGEGEWPDSLRVHQSGRADKLGVLLCSWLFLRKTEINSPTTEKMADLHMGVGEDCSALSNPNNITP